MSDKLTLACIWVVALSTSIAWFIIAANTPINAGPLLKNATVNFHEAVFMGIVSLTVWLFAPRIGPLALARRVGKEDGDA